MSRKTSREWIVKLIFQIEMNKEFENYDINLFFENYDISEKDKEFIRESISSIIKNLEEIDNYIMLNIRGWEFNRIAKVDIAILRVAINEILFNESIPNSVSINEAVEIAKIYSAEDAYKFINGVLASVVRK
ncbi:transcription antitermination factor NusB [Miniphocaeibacter massiliensis]|uniref:transcription antitermination factor NusB n=1 Tax=Miniphocaeibacter massiliensis TaxID=2041841 RepID=UPI000C07DB4E|nr:transcription antitermination factor NusB [Miniphocaeibacter massiliensis]